MIVFFLDICLHFVFIDAEFEELNHYRTLILGRKKLFKKFSRKIRLYILTYFKKISPIAKIVVFAA